MAYRPLHLSRKTGRYRPENGPDYDSRQFTGGVESIERQGGLLVFTFGAGGQICVNHGVTYVSPERH